MLLKFRILLWVVERFLQKKNFVNELQVKGMDVRKNKFLIIEVISRYIERQSLTAGFQTFDPLPCKILENYVILKVENSSFNITIT